jgi:DNA-binding NarL/FixJ family response regulator
LLATEPIRVAGLASIFDQPAEQDHPQLVPVIGSLPELLALASIEYIVVDLQSAPGSFTTLETIRHTRPDVRLIVIGPEGDDELVLRAIVAGARAYLGLSAGPEVIRKAIEVVTSGSIWAPRYLLSRFIDRLLKVSRAAPVAADPQLTLREQQVLELLLKAHSTREIASRLGIEQRTVKAYIGRLMRKTGCDNRIKLSMSALQRSLLPQEEDRQGGSEELVGTVTKQ